MKKQLQKIANTLVLYSYHISRNGLLDGKMGIILFLYRYSQYVNCKYYSEFADDLLDKVLASVTHISPDFENGLTGIGWTVNYLIKNGYIDGDPNDVLFDVDKRVFSSLRCTPDTSIFGQGLYLLERLKDKQSNTKFEKHVTNCLDFCISGIKGYKGQTSLYHLNSILYFLIMVEERKGYEPKVNSLKNLLPDILKRIFNDRIFDDADLYIFNRILNNIDQKQESQWSDILLFNTKKIPTNFNVESKIKISNLEYLYFGNSKLKKIPLKEISHFIDKKQESLTINDFLFSKGLTGFGNMILSNQVNNGMPNIIL